LISLLGTVPIEGLGFAGKGNILSDETNPLMENDPDYEKLIVGALMKNNLVAIQDDRLQAEECWKINQPSPSALTHDKEDIMNKKLILLVEDNPDDIALTMLAFKKSNILNEVVVAKDGVEALEYLFGTGKYEGRDMNIRPQLILLDLKMPKMDGLEVLQRMRADERTKLLPVVVLTTSSEDKDRIESYKLGANSYIRKPVDFIQFAEAVRQLGLYWIVMNEAP